MIQSIQIQNRQSHEDTDIRLHSGLNVFVGRGTAGKSAILRALRWPLENTAGTAHISRWIMREPKGKSKDLILDGETSVTIAKPQGTLKRFRNPDSNGYEINGKTLKAVGVTVPEEAKEFFDLSDVNIQGQFDPPFLISLPGSQVSAYLNRVVGIEEIDRYITASASCIREAKKTHKALVESQERDTLALEALAWVDGIQEQVDALDTLHVCGEASKASLVRVQAVCSSIETVKVQSAQAAKVAALEPRVQAAKKLAQAVAGVGSRLSSVVACIEGLEAAKHKAAKAAKVAGLAKALEAAKALGTSVDAKSDVAVSLHTIVTRMSNAKAAKHKAAKVAGLAGALADTKALGHKLESQAAKHTSVCGLRVKAATVKDSFTVATKIMALEHLMVKVYRFRRGLLATEGELESLRDLGLTIQGHRNKLVSKRTEVSELESKRPSSCPICGGAYGKDKCLGTP